MGGFRYKVQYLHPINFPTNDLILSCLTELASNREAGGILRPNLIVDTNFMNNICLPFPFPWKGRGQHAVIKLVMGVGVGGYS